jgi:hypothetical protein
MSSSPTDPTYWQGRAAEARAAATQMTDQLARTTMLALAARYERLAKLATTGRDIFSLYSHKSETSA